MVPDRGIRMIIGHIGARKGSRGVLGKNMRPICGRPLIDWSLDCLFDSDRIDHVVVSTDCEDIYAHGLARGTLPIGLRPDSLATDSAAKWEVWQHSLAAVENLVGQFSIFLDLDCTSPLRIREDISAALELFLSQSPDMVMSCCVARKNPYFNLVEHDETGALKVSKELPHPVVARQQAPLVYEHVGSVYVISPDYLRKASGLFEGRVIPYVMPQERCVDIDSELDFKIAQILLGERIGT